jgi:hypothetical protein
MKCGYQLARFRHSVQPFSTGIANIFEGFDRSANGNKRLEGSFFGAVMFTKRNS